MLPADARAASSRIGVRRSLDDYNDYPAAALRHMRPRLTSPVRTPRDNTEAAREMQDHGVGENGD